MKIERKYNRQVMQTWLGIQKRELERLESRRPRTPEEVKEISMEIIEIEKDILDTEQRLAAFAA